MRSYLSLIPISAKGSPAAKPHDAALHHFRRVYGNGYLQHGRNGRSDGAIQTVR